MSSIEYSWKNSSIHPILSSVSPVDHGRRKRLIEKNGDIVYRQIHLEDRHRYLKDLFTSLLDFSWTSILVLFFICFLLSWLIFASIWYLIMFLHGDFASDRLVLRNDERDASSCLRGVYSYWGTILFSIETQQTIGYGTRSINEDCSVAIVFLILQSCFGLLIQSLWVGLVYTRLSRPRKRRQTLIWSRQGVISLRDGWRVLQIRLGDMRQRSTLVEAHLRMYFVCPRTTKEGESMPLNLLDMNVGFAEGKDRIVLNWPLTIEHRIDEQSPFFRMDFSHFSRSHFEIFVILEGIIESTGMVTQAKTSFLPSEILWNRRFHSMIDFDADEHLVFDYNRFHQTVDDPFASLLSPEQLLLQQQREQREQRERDPTPNEPQ